MANSYPVKRGAAKAPISTHPAFPAIIALWFAALLGLGSLVLPVALLERLVTITGIAWLVPPAAPPLGFTARVVIALAGSIVGAVIGLWLARQVANSHMPAPKARSYAAGGERQCRPISAHDELGEEGLGSPDPGPSPLVQKRRSLALSEDNSRSQFLLTVPLPGQDRDAVFEEPAAAAETETMEAAQPVAKYEPDHEAESEPLELGAFVETDESGAGDAAAAIDEPQGGLEALKRRLNTPADPTAIQDQPMTDRPTFDHQAASAEDQGERQEFRSFDRPAALDEDEDATSGPSMPKSFEPAPGDPDPLPFAAPSLRRQEPDAFDDADEDEEPAEDEAPAASRFEAPHQFEAAPQLSVVVADGEPADDSRPLESLGLVQLAARLGASIAKRRAQLARREGAVPAPDRRAAALENGDEFEAVGPEDAARAIADFFGPAKAAEASQAATVPSPEPDHEPEAFDEESFDEPVADRPAIPAAMRGLSFDANEDEDEDDMSASFSLPMQRKPVQAFAPVDEEEVEGSDEEAADETEYSSLLAMKNPFARQQEFVRVEEPEDDSGAIEPTVTFPSQAPLNRAAQPGNGLDTRPFDPPNKPVESVAPAPAQAAPRDPGDAERNLRAALATLQRMSGAA